MPFNRELLASLTFEPSDVSEGYASSSDSSLPRAAKPDDAGSEDSCGDGQNKATKLIIRCLQKALTESIISISHPEKQRPLNPKTDFSIEATTEFARTQKDAKGGVLCCGPGSANTKSRRRGQNGGRRGRFSRRSLDPQTTSFDQTFGGDSLPYYMAGSGGDGAPRGSFRGGTVGGGRTEVGSTNPRRRRGGARSRSDAMTATEDDDYEGDGDALEVPFSFTDYSPMCYRHIREFFEVDPKEYCEVLGKGQWRSIPTPGKSAAQLFFCGRDWVIKTMTNHESEFLRSILHRYYYHVRDNPFTLLPHFVGHHQLKVEGETHNFIIMQNVFATTNTIHEKFDLKGSTIGRYASDAEKLRATCTQKDLDIHRPLHIGPERRQLLINQVKADCDFLKRSKIMDYSFLVGIHLLSQSRATARAGTAAAASPSVPHSVFGGLDGAGSPLGHTLDAGNMTSRTFAVSNMHLGMTQTDTPATGPLGAPYAATYSDGHCFTADQGGMQSTEGPGLRREIYYIGIIDVLQEYNVRKMLETATVGMIHDFQRISCVHPNDYAARFIAFMSSIIV